MTVRCAWCGRTPVDGIWIEPLDAHVADRTTHGICPDCFAGQERSWAARRIARIYRNRRGER